MLLPQAALSWKCAGKEGVDCFASQPVLFSIGQRWQNSWTVVYGSLQLLVSWWPSLHLAGWSPCPVGDGFSRRASQVPG